MSYWIQFGFQLFFSIEAALRYMEGKYYWKPFSVSPFETTWLLFGASIIAIIYPFIITILYGVITSLGVFSLIKWFEFRTVERLFYFTFVAVLFDTITHIISQVATETLFIFIIIDIVIFIFLNLHYLSILYSFLLSQEDKYRKKRKIMTRRNYNRLREPTIIKIFK